jgi:DNA-directed RNA polymerase specialized sigma subunit
MLSSQNQVISQRTKDLIDKLFLGKLSLPEIAKITGISEQWLQNYISVKYELTAR